MKKSEFDRVVANLLDRRIPSDGLPISVENALREDVGNEGKVVVGGALKEREYDFQAKLGEKQKKIVLPKKIDTRLSFRKD